MSFSTGPTKHSTGLQRTAADQKILGGGFAQTAH